MKTIRRHELLALVGGDDEFLHELIRHEIVRFDDEQLSEHDVESVLVAHTLVRELEVNWPGVEVILRMRRELKWSRSTLRDLQERGVGGTDVEE